MHLHIDVAHVSTGWSGKSMGGRLFAEFLSPMWPKCDEITNKNCYELSKTRFKADMEADHG